MRRQAMVMGLITVAATLGGGGCVPDWAKQGDAPVILLLTGINNGNVIDSDLRISSGSVCPDFAVLRLENHFKNPNVTTTGFRHDFTIERYEVHYFRSDGRAVEGVDVPFHITGNLAQEVQEDSNATLSVEVVRRQAKVEPPLSQLVETPLTSGANGAAGPFVVTMFAEITVWGRTTTGQVLNSNTARVQIDFADFGDTQTSCPTTSG
jgi:hypothetical protein